MLKERETAFSEDDPSGLFSQRNQTCSSNRSRKYQFPASWKGDFQCLPSSYGLSMIIIPLKFFLDAASFTYINVKFLSLGSAHTWF